VWKPASFKGEWLVGVLVLLAEVLVVGVDDGALAETPAQFADKVWKFRFTLVSLTVVDPVDQSGECSFDGPASLLDTFLVLSLKAALDLP